MSNTILYYPTGSLHIKAVTLVAHGLNVKPLSMLPFIHWLNSQGAHVYLIQLSGHYDGAISISEVTSNIWQQEMMEGYQLAFQAARSQSLPCYFLGYSLGALLGQSMILLEKELPAFDKQVLIAPATAIRSRAYLLKLLFILGKQFQLPSYTPKEYQFNKRLPLSTYRLLFFEEMKIKEANPAKLNIPTLIIMDPKDELISYKKLVKKIAGNRLTNYKLLSLNSAMKDRRSNYHHLIINEETMGKVNWEKATSQMNDFLFN